MDAKETPLETPSQSLFSELDKAPATVGRNANNLLKQPDGKANNLEEDTEDVAPTKLEEEGDEADSRAEEWPIGCDEDCRAVIRARRYHKDRRQRYVKGSAEQSRTRENEEKTPYYVVPPAEP